MGTIKPDFTPEKPNCIIRDMQGPFKAYICDKTGVVWFMDDGEPPYKYPQRWGDPYWSSALRLPLSGTRQEDPVEKPSHYGQGSIECIDYIRDFLTEEEYIGYIRGNVAKYLHRWRYKNGLEDLKKAQVYLGWMIETVEKDT